MKTFIKKIITLTLLLLLMTTLVAQADDTEIYFSSEVSRVNPNVLFVLDVSGSMDINVEGSGGEDIETHTLSRSISTKNDDVEESKSSKKVSRSSSDLELTMDGSTQQYIGLRFRDISIPNGAVINSAYIQFQTDETSNNSSGNILI
jgi:succinyl-CoA synthetase beta subunit